MWLAVTTFAPFAVGVCAVFSLNFGIRPWMAITAMGLALIAGALSLHSGITSSCQIGESECVGAKGVAYLIVLVWSAPTLGLILRLMGHRRHAGRGRSQPPAPHSENAGMLKLPRNWVYLEQDEAIKFEAELRRELCPQHVLYGLDATAIARRARFDDFLFQIPDKLYAQVHLTWRSETDPHFPRTELFSSIEEWGVSREQQLAVLGRIQN